MKEKRKGKNVHKKPRRLWPVVAAAILIIFSRLIVPLIIPNALPVVMFGGLFFSLFIIVWWVLFSRAPRFERWGALILMILSLVAVKPLLHKSIAMAGMGMLFFILAIPFISLAFSVWIVISRRFSDKIKRITMAATILLAVGFWALLRTEGLNNEGKSYFAWRWTKTSEAQLLSRDDESAILRSGQVVSETGAFWPGFRGADRDDIIRRVRIETDWSVTPPDELWRQPVGPGWSSFAVYGELFYTQEQRGEDEAVSCYRMTTGELIWRHNDKVRFWESNSGAGPRGTPTFSNGRIYTLGATGILNVLDAFNGSVIWSCNAATDTGTKSPYWGFSSSPLVIDDIVIVAVASTLIAYDIDTGEPRWFNATAGDSYSSPHLMEIEGVTQILFQNKDGISSFTPADGIQLWNHPWSGYPIVQPALTSDGDILVSVDEKSGIRCISVSYQSEEWKVEERWTSAQLKPYFNDSVFHNGCVFGFDGPFLACIDAEDGERKWRGGRYGRGQLILLADQDLLLVLSEKGELALVEAYPDEFREITRIPAIEGKTWNHPVLVNDILLVRNAQEMAAFRLTLSNKS